MRYSTNPALEAMESKIARLLERLQHWVTEEASQAFQTIIENNPKLHLYSLGLYYDAGGWGYIMPTFASEEGLDQVTEHYQRHSPLNAEEQRTSLRWSPCDSPHHDDETLDGMLPLTQTALDELSLLLDQADPDFGDIPWPEDATDEDYYQFIRAVHEDVRQTVIEGLQATRQQSRIDSFFHNNPCVLTLNAGDIDQDEFRNHVKALNSDETYQKVASELAAAECISIKESRLWDEKQEQLQTPHTDLTLDDFQDNINHFQPALMTVGESVFLEDTYSYPLEDCSECEEITNRIPLMDLLRDSPHFDEIDKLFGHFIGKQFEAEDLLPCIARAFVQRLGTILVQQYKTKTFRVLMVVDRDSLYYLTFHSLRDDGHEFSPFTHGMDTNGVYEVHTFNAKGDLLKSLP